MSVAHPGRELRIAEVLIEAPADFDSATTRQYGAIRQELGFWGELIATCVLASKTTLVTRNVGDFKRISDLKLESYEEMGMFSSGWSKTAPIIRQPVYTPATS